MSMTNKEKIFELARDDPTVNSLLMLAERDNAPWETTLEQMVLHLALEKSIYYKKAVELTALLPPQPVRD